MPTRVTPVVHPGEFAVGTTETTSFYRQFTRPTLNPCAFLPFVAHHIATTETGRILYWLAQFLVFQYLRGQNHDHGQIGVQTAANIGTGLPKFDKIAVQRASN